jgi:hypothetical protein
LPRSLYFDILDSFIHKKNVEDGRDEPGGFKISVWYKKSSDETKEYEYSGMISTSYVLLPKKSVIAFGHHSRGNYHGVLNTPSNVEDALRIMPLRRRQNRL